MAEIAKTRLSRLRDVGWSVWDPIGLCRPGTSWQDDPGADEYDGYLLKVAGMLAQVASDSACVDYLVWVETEHMGLGERPDTRERAGETVRAIRETLSMVPGKDSPAR